MYVESATSLCKRGSYKEEQSEGLPTNSIVNKIVVNNSRFPPCNLRPFKLFKLFKLNLYFNYI